MAGKHDGHAERANPRGTETDHWHREPNVARSASGRIPQWTIDEALEQDPGASNPGVPARHQRPKKRRQARQARRPREPRKPRAKRSFLVGLVIVVFLYFSPALFQDHLLPAARPYFPWSDVPPRGVEAAANPLGKIPVAPDSKAYKLLDSPDGKQEFVAYDPCRPIHYVIRPDGAPPAGERLIHEAVKTVSRASGLAFIYDGTTAEDPSDLRPTYQPKSYGKRWVPVLVAWSSPTETADLAGDVAGLGGSSYISAPGTPLVLAAGQIMLDAPDAATMLGYPQGEDHVRAVIMHEFGHVLGLDHVQDPSQLMYEGPSLMTSFAAGDLAGLAKVGTGACVPQL